MAPYTWIMLPRRDTSAWHLKENLGARMKGPKFPSDCYYSFDGENHDLPIPLHDLPETLVAANTKLQTFRHDRTCGLAVIQTERPTQEQLAAFADIRLPPSVFEHKYHVLRSAAEAKGINVFVEAYDDDTYRLVKARIALEDMDDEQKKYYTGVKSGWCFLSEVIAKWPLAFECMSTLFTPSRSALEDSNIDQVKLHNVTNKHATRFLGAPVGLMHPSGEVQTKMQVLNEILWRCVYISQFQRCSGERTSHPPRWLGHMYYPHLGPNISLDTFIYEEGILNEEPGFDFASNTLVQMYGFGQQELRWLLQNPNLNERAEQLRTLERFHLLQAWLGRIGVEDLVEQLRFCWYAVRDSKGIKYQQLPRARKEACIRARRRELNIAKIMVDRIWDEVERNRGERIIPATLRRRYGIGEDGRAGVVRQGDWHLLTPHEKKKLLGQKTGIHSEHGDYHRLLSIWKPDQQPEAPVSPGPNRLGPPPAAIVQDRRQAQHVPAAVSGADVRVWQQVYRSPYAQGLAGSPSGASTTQSMGGLLGMSSGTFSGASYAALPMSSQTFSTGSPTGILPSPSAGLTFPSPLRHSAVAWPPFNRKISSGVAAGPVSQAHQEASPRAPEARRYPAIWDLPPEAISGQSTLHQCPNAESNSGSGRRSGTPVPYYNLAFRPTGRGD